MGYLTKLYSLFPALRSDECCTEDDGKNIIRDVFHNHLGRLILNGFEEFEDELYSFRDIVRRNIEASYNSGLDTTIATRKVKKSDVENWVCLNERHKEEYFAFFDGLVSDFLKTKGNYPISAFEDTLYYNIDDGLVPENQSQIVSKVVITDYERGFVDVEYNERLFLERVLIHIGANSNKYLELNNLKSFIQNLFSDYIQRLGDARDLNDTLDSGLCWIHFTRQSVLGLVRDNTSGKTNQDAFRYLEEMFVEMRSHFISGIRSKMSPVRIFHFDRLDESDLKDAYKYVVKSVKQAPTGFSVFTESAFIDAIYRGDFKKIYINGLKDKLHGTIKVLKTYSEQGWVESVAKSVGKKVRQIDGTAGLNPGGFVDGFPIKPNK